MIPLPGGRDAVSFHADFFFNLLVLCDGNRTSVYPSWANLSKAIVEWTVFANIDLSLAKGLETIKHRGQQKLPVRGLPAEKGIPPPRKTKRKREHMLVYFFGVNPIPLDWRRLFQKRSENSSKSRFKQSISPCGEILLL
jgi:hypothetical protein